MNVIVAYTVYLLSIVTVILGAIEFGCSFLQGLYVTLSWIWGLGALLIVLGNRP